VPTFFVEPYNNIFAAKIRLSFWFLGHVSHFLYELQVAPMRDAGICQRYIHQDSRVLLFAKILIRGVAINKLVDLGVYDRVAELQMIC
jgi:hypothetical protein